MKYKLPLIVAGAITAIGASSVLAFADTTTTATAHQSLAAAIASKFGLKESDVQSVIDQNHQQNEAAREQNYQDRLDQAVKDGKITADQETKIVAKHKEIVAFMDSLKDKTPSERKAALTTERAQVEQWAKDNNIDLKWLMPFGGHGRGMRMGMHDNDGDTGDPASSTSTN